MGERSLIQILRGPTATAEEYEKMDDQVLRLTLKVCDVFQNEAADEIEAAYAAIHDVEDAEGGALLDQAIASRTRRGNRPGESVRSESKNRWLN